MEPHPQYWYDAEGQPITVTAAEALMADIHARRVALDDVSGWCVSTVHTVLDQNVFGDGPPLIFETMIFDANGESVHEIRTPNRQAALDAHRRACAEVPQLQAEGSDTSD